MVKRAWDARNYVRNLDIFGKDVPAFNINGEAEVKTLLGGILTCIVFVLTFSYATSTMIDLTMKKDVVITQSVESDFYSASNGLNLNQAKFRFAIAAGDFYNEPRNDPRYIKWIARMDSWRDGVQTEIVLNTHTCTDEDYS